MKILSSIFLSQFHFVILINTIYNGYFFYQEGDIQLRDLQEREANLFAKIKIAKSKIEKSKEVEEDYESNKVRLNNMIGQIEQVQRKLPDTVNDTEVLDLFSEEAKKINISGVQQSPQKEENKEFYFSKQYQFKGVGTFLQILLFFESLSEKDRLYNVRNLKITKSKEKSKGRYQRLDFTCLIEAFRYNPEYSNDIRKDLESTPSKKDISPTNKKKPSPGAKRGGDA